MDRRKAMLCMGVAALTAAATRTYAASRAPSAGEPLLMRRIPSSGERLPAIGLGTWQTFDVRTRAELAECERVLIRFAELGGRLIDSSPMYGRSEAVVGELSARHGLRPRQFIATKVWTQGKAAGERQMEDSMRKLRTQRIDLMQVHNLIDTDAHLDTLQDWKDKGRVRYLGVTHYAASAHEAVAQVINRRAIDFIQINYSVAEREAEKRLLPLARERGVAVIVNRPFAGGELFRRLSARPLPAWAAEIDCTSWAQLLLKFVISHPAVTCAIPGTGRVDHVLDNLGAGEGRLPDAKFRARIAGEAA